MTNLEGGFEYLVERREVADSVLLPAGCTLTTGDPAR